MAFSRDMCICFTVCFYKTTMHTRPVGHLLLDHCWVNIWPVFHPEFSRNWGQFSAANKYDWRIKLKLDDEIEIRG